MVHRSEAAARLARARLRLRAVAAAGHDAHLRVGRSRVLRVAAIVGRSTATWTSRTSISTSTIPGRSQTASFHETFLERENEAGRRLNFVPIGHGDPVGAVLRRGSPGRARDRRARRRLQPAVHRGRGATARRSTGFSRSCSRSAIARRLVGPRPGGEPRDLDRHAAAVLHVRRAAVLARVLGVRRVAVSLDVAARPRALDARRRRRARAHGRADGDGARAGCLLSRGAGDRFRARRGPRAARGTSSTSRTVARRAHALLALVGAVALLRRVSAAARWPTTRSTVTRARRARDPQDDVDVAARPAGALLARSTACFRGRRSRSLAIAGLVLLALGRVPTAARESRVARMAAARDVRAAGLHHRRVESWTVAGSFGQRRFVALTPLLVLGLAALAVAWSGARPPALAPRRRRARRRCWHLVERRPDGAVRPAHDGPPAADAGDNAWTTFVVLPREAPAHRLALPHRPRVVLRPATSVRRASSFADTRFPIERANGVQTMATCHALAARGHDVTLVVRPDTTHAGARSVRVLRPAAASPRCTIAHGRRPTGAARAARARSC